jgi:membrane fusion protein, multidrug efflux system
MHIQGYATTNLESVSNQRRLQARGLLCRITRIRTVHERRSLPWGCVMFNNETIQTRYTAKERAHPHLELETERSRSPKDTIAGGATLHLPHKKMLAASLGIVIGIAAAHLILDSVLYERTYDAHVNGQILPISARINGQVQEVKVIEGQFVHAGDILAVIDPKDYGTAIYHAQANLAYAENTAASLYYGAAITATDAYADLSSAQAAVKDAAGETAAAARQLRADEATLKRDQAGAEESDSDIVSLEQLELEAAVRADEQALLRSQEGLRQATIALRKAQTAPQQVSVAQSKAQAADSTIMEAKAQLEQAQLNLSYTIIRSPVTGIVGKRRIEVGQSVIFGQELIDVVSRDDVWITANFSEKQLSQLKPGQPVEIKIDAYGRTWRGHITNLGGGAPSMFSVMPPKTSTGDPVRTGERIPIRIDFDHPKGHSLNGEGMLRPGLSAESKVRVRWLPPKGLPAGLAPDSAVKAM